MTIYYVADTGNDSYNSTQAQNPATPWRSIQKGTSGGGAGDTVIVKAGTYAYDDGDGYLVERYTVYFSSHGGTAGNHLTIKSENPAIYDIGGSNHAIIDDQVVMDATDYGNQSQGTFWTDVNSHYITIDGFEIKNTWTGIHYYGHDTNITRNYLHHTGNKVTTTTQGAGAGVGGGNSGGSYNIIIDSNIFRDNGRTGNTSYGVYGSLSHNDHSIYIGCYDSTISNNIFYVVDLPGGVQHGSFIQLIGDHPSYFTNLKIINNTMIGAHDAYANNIQYWLNSHDPTGMIIANNLSVAPNGIGDGADYMVTCTGYSSVGCTVRNNITSYSAIVEAGGDYTLSNNTLNYASDPFVNAGSYNFHLVAGSAPINAAYESDLPAHDFDGIDRPQSANGDVGAYEYVSGTRTYSRGSYGSLPSDDADLTTIYSIQDYLDVADDDGTRVGKSGNGYVLHQFKDIAGASDTKMDIHCNLQTPLAPSAYSVYLQCYDRVTAGGMWVTVVIDNASSANTDFNMDFQLNSETTPTFANCKDNDTGEISSRVYQTNVPLM